MKKMMVLSALMLSAAAAWSQESRQDISVSATGDFSPSVYGPGSVQNSSTKTIGGLLSYRYMLTPRSALELNYSYAQNTQKYIVKSTTTGQVHSLQQEISGAYVFSLNFKRLSPFAEAGVGALIYRPLRDSGTVGQDVKPNTNIGALFGGGVAYELSPSFDIRAEYRVFVAKTPDFGAPDFKTSRYQPVSIPAIGIAYHF